MTAFALTYQEGIVLLARGRLGVDPGIFLFFLFWLWLPIGALVVNALLPKGSGPRVLALALGTIAGLAVSNLSGPCWADPFHLWPEIYHQAGCFLWVAGCTFAFTFVGARAVGSRQMSALRSAMFLIGLVAVLLLFSLIWLPQRLRAY